MMKPHSTSIALILGVILIKNLTSAMNKMPPPEIKIYPGFGRECTKGGIAECKFQPKGAVGGTVYFKCENATLVEEPKRQFCFCGTGDDLPTDELMWPLEWDGAKCSIGKGGPCGSEKGLEVNCRAGLDCLENRCRNQSEIRSATVNKFCNDDLDCQQGLTCQDSKVPTAVKTKRCY